MFTRHSPLKRKHSEYHDPDYPQQKEQKNDDDDDEKPGCSKHIAAKRQKSGDEIETKKKIEKELYYHKVREVISKEFQKEIVMKQEQLEEIDDRLDKAKHLLERLRYGIVSAYYKKQEIPVTSADAATIRGHNSLFDREEKGPQMPLHPSLKKLIGKRPKDLSEVIRTCPKRTAAQNAVQTIRAKSQSQKKEERKLKQIIRDQGIVIDHSKQNVAGSDVNTLLNAAAQNTLTNNHKSVATNKVKQESTTTNTPANTTSGKALNAARLNNKIKHLIVVGNTSKYIGNEAERDVKTQSQNLTHKWLVYVQSKETKQPIDRFLKKVRFHLHHSYRPNDIVDVNSPPFQVSRRGWGEFPIRVQLYFHPEYHQKPIQLVHNIVLDQTLSGIQTLGSETLLEIWLRDTKSMNSPRKVEEVEQKVIKKLETPSKGKNNLISRTEELVDDNLLEFLNKIEASPCSISADIEKIQPTVLVTEPLPVKLKTLSPEKNGTSLTQPQISPVKIKSSLSDLAAITEKSPIFNLNTTTNDITMPTTTTTVIFESTTFKTPLCTNGSSTSTYVKLSTNNSQLKLVNTSTTTANIFSNMPPLRPITPTPVTSVTTVSSANGNQLTSSTLQKPQIVLNKDGKILMPSASVASAVRRTILPIVNNTQPNIITLPTSQTQQLNKNLTIVNKPQLISVSTAATGASTVSAVPKQILQKKLVQLVDSTGKVKYIQMLVAASAAPSSVQNINTTSVAPKFITMAPTSIKSSTVTNTTQMTNTITTPLLKSTNGTYLTPAMTMKPNIFKIVPESMQTKPQIITFSTATTIAATNTNTSTIANTQQQVVTTATRTIVGQIKSAATTTVPTKSNNTPLAVANKIQRHNGNAVSKNLVFQREGKLYIIDPQQMKYKQQQKKQVSLLKPQISLLKQQQQQQKNSTLPTTTANNNSVKPLETRTSPAQTSNNYAPPVHYGLKQQRINSMNALQLLQMKKVLFEKQFYRQEFNNMRSAVEFLLRRLKLIVSKDSLVSAFPFVCHTLQEFHSLTAFKQRACEWLRAKNISRLMRNHKDLQNINQSSKEVFWSTKEIATFARRYAYTPVIKSLPRPGEQILESENGTKDFMDLVKSELKQEHLQYDTLTDQQKVRKWVNKIWHTLEDYEHHEDENQIIDIDVITEEPKNDKKCIAKDVTPSKHYPLPNLDFYMPPPPELEHSCELVSDICKDLSIKLNHEELDTRVYHQSTRTVLAQCLHLFIEKILRQSIALKQENHSTTVADSICTILPQDLAKVIATSSEFDFLTNNNFGSTIMAECLMSSIKQEKS